MQSKQVAAICNKIEVIADEQLEWEFEVNMSFTEIYGLGDVEGVMNYPLLSNDLVALLQHIGSVGYV
ncbi:hypothetical protein ColTof4_06399 [Colletotrichum tofieldiae]|nr:hypothetical protein ColTof3_01591 [Colletotrichum tofieldiae]GKT73976.1 hypothetical protein ColTof4_06399 [Colletotrichum tofieldiae]GKT95961.1 hypothetical protein Ct61P_13811 [Colletotrichum tofieldiae]